MIQVLISGFILGVTIAVIIGPAFFSLLQTSIHRGFRIGMYMALGILLSDFTLIALCFLGISQLISGDKYSILFGIIGGVILLAYGAYTFRKKTVYNETSGIEIDNGKIYNKIKAHKPFIYIIKGYLLNLINPFLLIFWMGVMGFVVAEYNSDKEKLAVFFGTSLATVFATDLLKCFVANKIKRLLNPKVLKLVNHGLGILLIVLGVYLMIKTLIVFSHTGILIP